MPDLKCCISRQGGAGQDYVKITGNRLKQMTLFKYVFPVLIVSENGFPRVAS